MTAEKKEKAQWIILIALCIICAALTAGLIICILQTRFLTSELEYLRKDYIAREESSAEESSEADPFADITAPPEQGTAAFDPAARSLYESQCQTVSYEQLNRGGDSLIRQYFTFTGKILQAMDGSYRLGVGDRFKDVIYLEYELPAGAERLLEDDFVTVWGQSLGLYTYTSVSDKSITVPRLLVGYLDRITETEIAARNAQQYTAYDIADTQKYAGCTVTLEKILVRPAKDTDGIAEPEGKVTVLFLFDCMNRGEEDAEFSKYTFDVWIDSYAQDFLYGADDTPDGYQPVYYETIESGHGIRGYLALAADADFAAIELRSDPDDDGNVLHYFFRPESGE